MEDEGNENYDRFHDPEAAFLRMVQDNKDINKQLKDEGKKQKYIDIKS